MRSNNFHIAGIFPVHDAKALTVESPLITRLPRGHRQFISVLDGQGIILAEALLSADQDVIDVDMPERIAEDEPARQILYVPRFLCHGRGTHPDRL